MGIKLDMNGLLVLVLCAFCCSVVAKPPTARRAQLHDDVQLIHPHIITIERLENLLRRAGEIFGPALEEDAMAEASSQVKEQPKLDAKSRMLEKIAPPPQKTEHNYYAEKPKKKPKKFNAANKHINLNLKWLNTYERAMGGATAPKAMYLEQDERNRINFDDSFFAVDMQVKIPDNQPHKESAAPTELLQHGEEQAEEDLMAAPAQLAFNFKSPVQDERRT
ncbi:GM20362 [Drosophila sechellia]|uniref:GM20362 n=1 Tax=Drosophila sechellia TaxID=7238 RepID=B4HPI7_DROSE|nr:GM20362 [Drosophila sechellia]